MLDTDTPLELDVTSVRADFPVLGKLLPKGLPVTYLDTGASAQKPQCVIDKESEIYETHYANAYRGVYRFGHQISEELEASRETIASFIGAQSSDEIIFTAGCTMSLNMVASSWGKHVLDSGDEILLTLMEHHANIVPWQMIAEQTGAVLRYLPLTADGRLDLSSLDEYITGRTKIVAVSAMSNVLGTINPIRELTEAAHGVGAVIVVDAAQSVPHCLTDVVADGVDFLAFSGHKVYGPSGVGVLYGRHELLERMPPFMGGGHMIDRVYQDHSEWAAPPAKFEAGTLPIAQAIAMGTAVDYLSGLGIEAAAEHEATLLESAHRRLNEIPGMKIYGPSLEDKGAIVSFTVDGAHPEDLAQLLDRKGVFVRHGHHCAMPLHDWLGVSATVRASFGVYNDESDIDRLVDAIGFARERLRLV